MGSDQTLEVTKPQQPSVAFGKARLITAPNDAEVLTFVRMADARSSMARGLEDYFKEAGINWLNGARLEFVKVMSVWSSPESPGKFPSMVILADTPATYEDSHFTPQTIRVGEIGDGRYLRIVAGVKQVFKVQVWANDAISRSGLVAMVEDMFEPNEWMTGLRLELPYYFGARATYEKTDVMFDDSGQDAQQGWRRATFMVSGHIPQIRPVGDLPLISFTSIVDAED